MNWGQVPEDSVLWRLQREYEAAYGIQVTMHTDDDGSPYWRFPIPPEYYKPMHPVA